MKKQHCSIDLQSTREIIQRFRDLINIGPMLEMDYMEEIMKFRKILLIEGYDKDRIHQFVQLACFGTIYESELPPPIKNKGDYWEWIKNASKYR